jgi:large subunit ribosomal protein L21
MEIAVIATGGKQYRVSPGETVKIEKIPGDHKKGGKITFDKVLFVDDGKNATIGTPYIKGAAVEAEIVDISRAPKVTVIRYKAKSRYFKKRGHKQPYFKVKIKTIK